MELLKHSSQQRLLTVFLSFNYINVNYKIIRKHQVVLVSIEYWLVRHVPDNFDYKQIVFKPLFISKSEKI